MQNINKDDANKLIESRKQKIQPVGSHHSDGDSRAEKYQLKNLSERTAMRLEQCMESLAKTETIESVQAICLCASELNKIMKLNLAFYKEREKL